MVGNRELGENLLDRKVRARHQNFLEFLSLSATTIQYYAGPADWTFGESECTTLSDIVNLKVVGMYEAPFCYIISCIYPRK